MSKKNMQFFVSSVETFRDDGSPESKTEYNLDGEVTHVFTYDEHGNPLSGVCGDCMSWRMLDANTIQFEGVGEMDDYGPDRLPPWHMHEITTVEIEDGVFGVGRNAFSRHLTNARIRHVSTPASFLDEIEALCLFDEDLISSIHNKEDKK